jgi:N-methylhydantoinase B
VAVRTALDPIAVEIIQNRLMQIGHEGGIVLMRCAVSPTVVEAHDMGFNVADHLGRTVVYSTWMPRHGTTLSYMLAACKARFGDDIRPGDMYLVNDPHSGALHILDLAVIAPVHVDGKLVAWVANATHHIDVGAMTPGRAPLATSSHQEGILFKPVRLVEDGRIREDVFGLFLDNVRMPRYQSLDLKGQISANFAASAKVQQLARRYGTETLFSAYDAILDLSEAKARERIRELPEGRYEAVEHIDFDRHYTLRCALEVRGDELHFDFAGTDPEARTFVNSALACTVANLHNIVACQLLPDITPNAGAFRAVQVNVPEGSLLNCRPPAPASGASTITGWKTQQLTIATLSQALARSEKHSHRAMAQWGWGFTDMQWTGTDQQGRWYSVRGDASMHGGGGRRDADGIDVANIAGSTNTSLAAVESYEQRYPVLYLHRGMVPDSEGAGRERGGFAGSWSRCLYGVGEAESLPWYMGRDFGANGFAGGLEGQRAVMKTKHRTRIQDRLSEGPPSYEELDGDEETLAQQMPMHRVTSDDVAFVRGMGGGGYGDPRQRDPALVAADVADGLVSVARARDVYGVVVDATGGVDEAATTRLRTSSTSSATTPSP